MVRKLVDGCYSNPYGFDFKEFHINKCNISENEHLFVNEINHGERVNFTDGKSSSFKLVIYDGLIYLMYPPYQVHI